MHTSLDDAEGVSRRVQVVCTHLVSTNRVRRSFDSGCIQVDESSRVDRHPSRAHKTPDDSGVASHVPSRRLGLDALSVARHSQGRESLTTKSRCIKSSRVQISRLWDVSRVARRVVSIGLVSQYDGILEFYRALLIRRWGYITQRLGLVDRPLHIKACVFADRAFVKVGLGS